MSGKKYVPEGVWLVCDKGVKPSQLRSLSYSETVIMGEHMCTRMDKVLAVNFDPFGACACCNGSPCTAPVIDWTHVTDKIRLGGNLLLLENSELLCSLGGRIRIFYTLAAASAACGASREEERSFWSKAIDFGKGLGKGLWKGLKGTVTGVIDLGIWAGKHSLPYMLLDPAGFADQLKQDGETLKSLGNLAGKAGTWMYRNSAVNLLANPQDFLAAQQENRAMLETLADKAANMSAEEWGDFAGQVLFEVGTEVATAGGAAALTAVKAADKVVDVAKAANRVDDVLDAAKALDKLDDAADIAKAADKLDDAADAAKALDKAKVPKLEMPVKSKNLFRKPNFDDFVRSIDDSFPSDEIARKAFNLFENDEWGKLEELFKQYNINGGWPPNRGFASSRTITLSPGFEFDRYGGRINRKTGKFEDAGSFIADKETPYGYRSLPSGYEEKPLNSYRVKEPIQGVQQGEAIPWFGQEGGGIQYEIPASEGGIDGLLNSGKIERR